jgi:hypothetical protein
MLIINKIVDKKREEIHSENAENFTLTHLKLKTFKI